MIKYALVTGGSRGIGRAVCLKLAESGCNILINYRSDDQAAEQTAHEVRQFGVEAELLKVDISDAQATKQKLDEWTNAHPDAYVSIIVNNAGIRRDNLMVWMPHEDWTQVLNTTLGGFYNVTQPLLQTMLQKRKGRIINIASLSGLKGLPGQTNYSAAKGGLIAATKALAQEVAKRGVTVNAVAPGFISTDMTQDLDQKELSKQVPVGRFGRAEEVADLVVFLASDKASYITGEVISINGGLY